MTPDAPSICDVLPGMAAMLEHPDTEDRLGLADDPGRCRQVVLVLIDGLGLHLLPRLVEVAPWLASVVRGSTGRMHALRAPFPSTTPTSLVSLTTGRQPGEHGILGFTVSVPGTSRVLTHVLWRDDPPPDMWQPVPTWFEQLNRTGRSSAAVLPARFANSGLTRAAYRGARFVPLADGDAVSSRVDASAKLLAAGVDVVYNYTSTLDAAAHRFGVDSPQWVEAARTVDTLLAGLASALPAGAALLVTADHGGLNIPFATRIDIDAEPDLAAGIAVIAGEPRVRYLHTEPGASPDVLAAWQSTLGDRALVMTRDQAVDSNWFGPTTRAHAARIGDVVVVCRGELAVLATKREPAEVAELIGMHGADSDAETAVPLIVVTA